MRRLAKLMLTLAFAGALALVISTVAQGSDSYKFDVIFDDAHGLISGQEVKIAGAEAGDITDVVVTANEQARVEATITGPFQFHTNATCTIRPDGLIAENYLDCDPGSAGKPLLRSKHGFAPTVPISQTSEPVTLQDLFDIFDLPTRERFQVLVDELGIATAGNGNRINAILERANPTLVAAQGVIKILDAQTAQLSNAITATNHVALVGANHTAAVHAFINQAAGLTQLTSDHSSSLEQAINKLPAFLNATTPAMKQLNTVAVDGTPLLADLRQAAPSFNRVDADIVPFAKVATPALTHLSSAISTVTPDAKTLAPVVGTISNYLQASRGSTANFSKLIVNLIQHGLSESFLSVLYYTSTALAKHDANSHLLSSLLVFPGDGACAAYSTTVSTDPDCTAHYGAQAATPERADRTHASQKRTAASSASAGGASAAIPSSSLAGAVASTASTASTAPTATTTTQTSTTGNLQSLLNYLLQ